MRIRRDDEGFVLIYVLGIATLVTILATTAITVTTSNIKPTQHSVYANAASAAAQAGISTYVAELKSHAQAECTAASAACLAAVGSPAQWITGANTKTCGSADWGTGISGAGYAAGFATTARVVASLDVVRVTATGCAGNRGMNSSTTLVADIQSPKTSYLTYGNITKYETQGSSALKAQFPQRTIAITDSAAQHAANNLTTPLSGSATVSWGGAKGGTLAPSYLSTDACDELWYAADGAPGRATQDGQIDSALDAAAEAHPALPGAPGYVDWGEQLAGGGSLKTSYAYHPCTISLGGSTTLAAPDDNTSGPGGYYTSDALLLSNGVNGGTGPAFDQPVTTSWAPTDTPQASSSYYRSFDLAPGALAVGGAPAVGSAYPSVSPAPYVLSPPTSLPTPVADACVYTGPTRIRVSGTTAYVTSPMTTTAHAGSDSACYGGTPGAGGVVEVAVPDFATVTHGAVYVTGVGTSWGTTGQKSTTTPDPSHSVFWLGSTAGAATSVSAGSVAVAAPTAAWTGTYNPRAQCSAVDATNRQLFNCDWSGTTGAAYPPGASATVDATDQLAALRTCLTTDLANATAVATAGLSGCASAQTIDAANSASAAVGSTWVSDMSALLGAELGKAGTATDHRYQVSTTSSSGPTAGTPQTVGATPNAPSSDPLYANSSGNAAKQTPYATSATFAVSRQQYGCYVPQSASITGTLATILSLLGLSPTPGQFDATGKYCTTMTAGIYSAPGPGVMGWGSGAIGAKSTQYGGSVPAFSASFSQTRHADFVPATAAVSYFPNVQDVTQYAITSGSNTPGDLYLEGSAGSTISFTADHDIVLTGSLTPASSSVGIGLVAKNDVRVYHPAQCTDQTAADINATSPGFCPNDITGLYYGVPASGTAPYQQYADLQPAQNLQVDAAIFALGLADPACSGCGGQFTVDNFNRGAEVGRLTVTGTTVQVHHGPTGVDWEATDVVGASRAHSGYALTLKYRDLSPFNIVGLPSAAGRGWHMISTSTAGS